MTCSTCHRRIKVSKNTPAHNYWKVMTPEGLKTFCQDCKGKE